MGSGSSIIGPCSLTWQESDTIRSPTRELQVSHQLVAERVWRECCCAAGLDRVCVVSYVLEGAARMLFAHGPFTFIWQQILRLTQSKGKLEALGLQLENLGARCCIALGCTITNRCTCGYQWCSRLSFSYKRNAGCRSSRGRERRTAP